MEIDSRDAIVLSLSFRDSSVENEVESSIEYMSYLAVSILYSQTSIVWCDNYTLPHFCGYLLINLAAASRRCKGSQKCEETIIIPSGKC